MKTQINRSIYLFINDSYQIHLIECIPNCIIVYPEFSDKSCDVSSFVQYTSYACIMYIHVLSMKTTIGKSSNDQEIAQPERNSHSENRGGD